MYIASAVWARIIWEHLYKMPQFWGHENVKKFYPSDEEYFVRRTFDSVCYDEPCVMRRIGCSGCVPGAENFWFVHVFFVCFWRNSPQRSRASSFTRFLDHTQRRTTVGWNPLDEWSVRRRDLYLTTQNTHKRLTSMSPVGFEPTISAGERPQTHTLDRAATVFAGYISRGNTMAAVTVRHGSRTSHSSL